MQVAIPLILKFDDWPEEDQKRCQEAFAPGGFFSRPGAFAKWSAGTISLHKQGYGEFLSYILRIKPDLFDQPPDKRVTPEIVAGYVEERLGRQKYISVSTALRSLATVMDQFEPEADYSWLWREVDYFYDLSNPGQLKPPIPISSRDIYRWAVRELHLIDQRYWNDALIKATSFRQALSIARLIARPVRVRTYMAMTVSRHIDVVNGGIVLRFSAAELKDKRERDIPLPDDLVPWMLQYLRVHRPVLLGGRESDALWISDRGNALCEDSFSSGLVLVTRRAFGLTLRPHSFRHVAATSVSAYAPDDVGIIKIILGHATMKMANAHYNRATGVAASKKVQDIYSSARATLRKRGPRHSSDVP